MIQTDKPGVRVAILDLYDGIANEGMRGFRIFWSATRHNMGSI
jgi:hypothetical protein